MIEKWFWVLFMLVAAGLAFQMKITKVQTQVETIDFVPFDRKCIIFDILLYMLSDIIDVFNF